MVIIVSHRDLQDYAKDNDINEIKRNSFNIGIEMLFSHADAIGYIHKDGQTKIMKMKTAQDQKNLNTILNALLNR